MVKKCLARLVRVSPALVVAMLALLVALGGVSTAASIQTSPQASDSKQAVGANRGPRGRRGPRGVPGPRGPAGLAGPAGPAGAQGPAGSQGQKGDPGPAGTPGATGPQGLTGQTGQTGQTGADGQQGPQGPQGPGAVRLNVSLANPQTLDLAAAGFTLRLSCGGGANFRTFSLSGLGSGGGQIAGVKSINDAGAPNFTVPFSAGNNLTFGGAALATIGRDNPFGGNTNGFFYRLGGTLVMYNASGTTTVVYDMFLDDRSNTGTCSFRGTAVPAT